MAAPAPGAAKAKRSVGLVIALAVLAMALAAGGGYYWMTFGPGAVPAAEQPPADAAPPPADVAAAQPEVPPAAADTQPPPPDAATALPPPTGAPATAAKPAGTPGGTVGEAGRRSARPRSGSVTPIVPAEPPAPTIVAPPPPVETPPAAVAEPSSPPKRVDNGAAKTTLPELSFRKVKIVTELDTGTREIEVNLMFQDDRLGVSPAGGGATFRTVRYRDVQSASYAKAQKKRLFIKSSKHLLTIETADQPLVLRLDKDNFEAIITALEARTSKTVER
jgi:hypothetical protein